jgi:hypothetical protein
VCVSGRYSTLEYPVPVPVASLLGYEEEVGYLLLRVLAGGVCTSVVGDAGFATLLGVSLRFLFPVGPVVVIKGFCLIRSCGFRDGTAKQGSG